MKILIWTQCFWPENLLINDVAKELSQRGLDITVITAKPNYPEGRFYKGYKMYGIQTEYYAGLKVIRLPIFPRASATKFRLSLNYLSFVFSGFIFAPKVLRGQDFDLTFIYATSPLIQALPAIYVSKLKKMPVIIWVQDLWPEILVDHLSNNFFFKAK